MVPPPSTPHRLSSAANVKKPRAPEAHNPLAHQESSRFPTQKFALWPSGLKDNAGWSEPLKGLGLENGSAAWRSRASPRKPRTAAGTRPMSRRRRGPLPQHPQPAPPPGLRLGRTHARRHAHPPTAAPLPAPPQGPPARRRRGRRAHAQRRPAEGVQPLAAEPEAATRPRLRPLLPGAAAGRSLPATTATPLRRRACVAAGSAPRFHDDRGALQGYPPR